jgi:hypothetical protein
MFQDKICRENQNNRFYVQRSPPPKNYTVYEIMWKYMVQPDRPQIKIQYGAEKCNMQAEQRKQQYRHTLIIRNTECFYTATKATRTRVNFVTVTHIIRTMRVLYGYIFNGCRAVTCVKIDRAILTFKRPAGKKDPRN